MSWDVPNSFSLGWGRLASTSRQGSRDAINFELVQLGKGIQHLADLAAKHKAAQSAVPTELWKLTIACEQRPEKTGSAVCEESLLQCRGILFLDKPLMVTPLQQ